MRSRTCIEIIGPPGAGKTTLARELVRRYPEGCLRTAPSWRRLQNFPFFVRNGLPLLPDLAAMALSREAPRYKSVAYFYTVFLRGWWRRLAAAEPLSALIILDQGPVYMLSELIFFHEKRTLAILEAEKWRASLQSWGEVLEGVIRLDAEDDVLARRINARAKGHVLKGAPRDRTQAWLEWSRTSLDMAMDMLGSRRNVPAPRRFDTGRQSVTEIADLLCREWGIPPEGEKTSPASSGNPTLRTL